MVMSNLHLCCVVLMPPAGGSVDLATKESLIIKIMSTLCEIRASFREAEHLLYSAAAAHLKPVTIKMLHMLEGLPAHTSLADALAALRHCTNDAATLHRRRRRRRRLHCHDKGVAPVDRAAMPESRQSCDIALGCTGLQWHGMAAAGCKGRRIDAVAGCRRLLRKETASCCAGVQRPPQFAAVLDMALADIAEFCIIEA